MQREEQCLLLQEEKREHEENGEGNVEMGEEEENARVIPPNADHLTRLGFDRRHQLLGREKEEEQSVDLSRNPKKICAPVLPFAKIFCSFFR